ncbi:MAG: alpha/beta hydrolase fold domain-containing protein, partial [Anaerolineae bacterium]
LDEVLVEYPPQTTPRRVYLPLLMKDWFGEPTVSTDVTFAVVEGESLALDAYLPAAPGPHPAVILIHGGYWQTGGKESHSRLGEWMAEHNYAAFAINYRLALEFPFPAAVADVQCAIAWVREHATEYDVDADRIALMGTSAGGHLAALAGLSAAPSAPSASWQPSCGDPAADLGVQAVISCFGPVDLAFHAQESEPAEGIVAVFLGGQACQDAPQLCAAASPMTYVTADAPPTLLIHGTDDAAVSYENSARLYAALDAVGAEATYLPVEGAQHGFIIGVQSPKAQMALDAVADFLAAAF